MLNLSVILEDTARTHPNKKAFVFRNTHLTFKELDESASRLANALSSIGVKRGDKVAISCPNMPSVPIIMFGVLKAGAVFVPLNILLKPEEIALQLSDCEAAAYFCFEGYSNLPLGAWGKTAFDTVETCKHLIAIPAQPSGCTPFEGASTLASLIEQHAPVQVSAATNADDTAIIIYTSGTTGEPKGAELTHSNVLMNAFLLCDLIQYREDDVSLVVLPLFHVFGLIAQMASGVLRGVTQIVLPRFDPEAVLQLMQSERISLFFGAPTMYWALLHHQSPVVRNLSEIGERLRCCVSAGQSIPGETLKAFEARFKTMIIEGYGMSETSPGIAFNRLDMQRKIGSVGTPFWGVQVKIVDDNGIEVAPGESGEIIVRGHNVMKGYYNAPEKTAEFVRDGWMHTGDVGRFDEDGYLFIVDRLKEMINRGGEKVFPTEIEKMLASHDAVSMVAVIATPDEKYGEEIKACIVLKDGAEVSEQDIIDWTKERVALHKYPRRVEFFSELPVSATGKILKKALRKREFGNS